MEEGGLLYRSIMQEDTTENERNISRQSAPIGAIGSFFVCASDSQTEKDETWQYKDSEEWEGAIH